MATYFRLRILYKNMSASETLTLNGNHLKTQESFCNLSDLHDLTLIRFTSRSSLGKPFMAEEEEGGGGILCITSFPEISFSKV